MTLSTGRDSNLKLVKPKKQAIISISQWLEAWEVYMAIYTSIKNCKHIQALLTYSCDIRNMSKLGYDLLGFDKQFRLDQEVNKCSYATVRHDLHLIYGQSRQTQYRNQNSFQRQELTPQPNQSQQPFHTCNNPMYTAQGHAVPQGYCVRFHTRDLLCDKGTECPYMHKCPTCNKRHPVYEK